MSKNELFDWSQTGVAFLHAFEETMSCPICRELLVRAPKITDCGHTFCSECITRYMTQHNICPVCRSSIHRGALRANKKVEDIADLWITKTRPSLWNEEMKHDATQTATGQPISPASVSESTSNVNGREDSQSTEPKMGAPNTNVKNTTEPTLVQCPICEKSMTAHQLQTTHIDRCSSNPGSNSSLPPSPYKRANRAVFGQEYPETKLSLPTVDAMTDAKLRSKLKDAGLSTKGNKARLKARYTEWVTIYNATVDDKHPQPVDDLRRRMIQWDKAQDRAQAFMPNLKELDRKTWIESHKGEYDELIEQARKNKKRKSNDNDMAQE